MREFCWKCHRWVGTCFCAQALPFASDPQFALVVHPLEVKSTVGTAWILRRSISNVHWLRSMGSGMEEERAFMNLLASPDRAPLLLFPGPSAMNLNHVSGEDWRRVVPLSKSPLFVVIDGTWTQAKAMLSRSPVLQRLPRVSFDTVRLSEYGFKKQPHPACLSSVEGVHRVIEVMAERGWGSLPANREHDRMIDIFREMARVQMKHEAEGIENSARELAQSGYSTSDAAETTITRGSMILGSMESGDT